MKIIDLTLAINECSKINNRQKKLHSNSTQYTALIHDFEFDSMTGTYIDLPGHIIETNDGLDMANYPVAKLYRRESAIVALNKEDGSGAVSAEDLKNNIQARGNEKVLIINALGIKRFDKIEERSVYLDESAIQWIIDSNFEILISDIYESKKLEGVFLSLFKAKIATVCYPVNLYLLDNTQQILISIMPLKAEKVTQAPCRIIAEVS